MFYQTEDGQILFRYKKQLENVNILDPQNKEFISTILCYDIV